jgi:hypothetical protein
MAYEQELGSADRYYDATNQSPLNAAKPRPKFGEQVRAQNLDFLQNEHSGS